LFELVRSRALQSYGLLKRQNRPQDNEDPDTTFAAATRAGEDADGPLFESSDRGSAGWGSSMI
jgi:hypothetical protein